MATKNGILSTVEAHLDQESFRQQHWEGSFDDYLELVAAGPEIARNAFQRIYDMILHFGFERYTNLKRDLIRYTFFADPIDNGADAIFGLDSSLMNLVDFFKSAAHGYGTERRILGSSARRPYGLKESPVLSQARACRGVRNAG